MNFYLIGSLEGFNDLRFPNVEDWQNCMGHAEGLLKQWNPPEMEYIWKKIKTFWRLYIKNFSIFDKNIF